MVLNLTPHHTLLVNEDEALVSENEKVSDHLISAFDVFARR
jgi:hypothetical protein